MLFSLGMIDQNTAKCSMCKLNKDCNHPKFPIAGEGELGVFLLFKKPSSMEDFRGKAFSGEGYHVVREALEGFGVSMDNDCWKGHAINCNHPGKPSDAKIKKYAEYCFPYIDAEIKKRQPKIIICFGGEAASVVLGKRFSDTSAGRWEGLPFWSPEYNAWCIVTYDPSIQSKGDDGESYNRVIKRDVIKIFDYYKKKVPKPHNPHIECEIDFRKIVSRLDEINEEAYVLAVDFETTSLKPDNSDTKIVSCSYTYVTREDKKNLRNFSFLVSYNDHFTPKQSKIIRKGMAKIARNKNIKKVAHHLKFEENWTRKKLGVRSRGWIWCTMYTAHILDERPGHVGLKLQAFLHFQADAYEDKTKKYLKALEPGGNSLNKAEKIPVQDLLLYNGYDTYYTFLLFLKQRKIVNADPALQSINKLFTDGAIAFADLEEVGFGLVEGYFEKAKKDTEKEIETLKREILETAEAKKFKKKIKRSFQFNSDKDISLMVYNALGTEIAKTTESGKAAVDAEVLMNMAKFGNEWAKKFLLFKKLSKANDTFISGMLEEMTETGENIHPFYHLFTTRTGRSSSSGINFTNLPKRDKMVKKLIRDGIRSPFPGHIFCEADYASLEVKIAGCVTKDPYLIAYLMDKTTDMHRDTAMNLFFLPVEYVNSEIRFYAKNGFVFANFYGASPKSEARNLWKVLPDLKLPDTNETPLLDWLAQEQGITSYQAFEAHIVDVAEDFWKKFKVFKKWQNWVVNFYIENGYVENFFGFRRRGFLRRNEIINAPIQGTAFQCLLWSLIQVSKRFRKERMESRCIGQIHDSLLSSIYPDEFEHAISIIRYVMETKLKDEHPFIIVPMEAEFEKTDPGGTWFTLQKFEANYEKNFIRF